MRRVGLFSLSALLRSGDERQRSLRPEVEHSMEEEAARKGFMRRDSVDAKVYMEEHLHRPEVISGGVAVANLPPVEREKTEFDVYQRSTRDFTSQVTPHRITGVGIGAGFGAKEDKRLGFLRPRKLQPFGGDKTIVPKYDENGMPIDESLSKEQLRKQRMAYMKSFEGTTMSHREHFLLVDLDFEKDAALFGTTREEFERNVTRLKEVIHTYTRWERTDNFYYYGTILVKLLTAWVLMESVQQYSELRLLASHYDDFAEATDFAIAEVAANRRRDLSSAAAELVAHPPDFAPIVAAIAEERRRIESTPAATAKSHPMDTSMEEKHLEAERRREAEREMRRLHTSATPDPSALSLQRVWRRLRGKERHAPLRQEDFVRLSYAASPTSVEALRAVRRALLPKSEDYTQIVREEMVQYRQSREAALAHPE